MTRGLRVSVARTISFDSFPTSPPLQKDDNSKSQAFTSLTFQQAIQGYRITGRRLGALLCNAAIPRLRRL
ncbi:unnamed protein product [Victoria cruziana]